MTRYSDFVKRYMKKTGKSWNCSVCDIQTGNLYNTFKKGEDSQIKSDGEMMGGEDRDAPKIIKIKIKRRPVVSGQVQGETLQPSPIPPPEPLVPADANTRTAVALSSYIPSSINNKYRLEIMLALTYLVPKRINVNSGEDKKTYGAGGRDESGKLVKQDVLKKEVKQRLHILFGRPFTSRDATKLADEIVKPGEKSDRIKVMIEFMTETLEIELPDAVTPDWKFKYSGQFYKSYDFTETHSNLFRDFDVMLDIIEYGSLEEIGFSEEEDDDEEETPKPRELTKEEVEEQDRRKRIRELKKTAVELLQALFSTARAGDMKEYSKLTYEKKGTLNLTKVAYLKPYSQLNKRMGDEFGTIIDIKKPVTYPRRMEIFAKYMESEDPVLRDLFDGFTFTRERFHTEVDFIKLTPTGEPESLLDYLTLAIEKIKEIK